VDVCCCISNLRFILYCLAYSAFLCFNGISACIGHTCNTTRVQHDTVIPCASSYSVYYYLSSPTPSATRAYTYDYVTHFKINIARSSGPSSDVTI
jgi:hypothetical protein